MQDLLKNIVFNADGLVPAIAQDWQNHLVLMHAWMNIDSISETMKTGRVCYWSRSRQTLWRKGETSGNIQLLHEMLLDCDGDTLLLKVKQTGPACHMGWSSCFEVPIWHSNQAR